MWRTIKRGIELGPLNRQDDQLFFLFVGVTRIFYVIRMCVLNGRCMVKGSFKINTFREIKKVSFLYPS